MAQQSNNTAISIVDVAGGVERFKKYKDVIAKTLPKDVVFERYWTIYMQVAQTFISDPKITDKKGVLTTMMNAVKLSLIPDPIMGQIYFVPFSGKLTYQVGYKGMIELSRRSGLIAKVYANLVYDCDEFDFWIDENGQHYKHKPKINVLPSAKKEICAYSVFEYTNGIKSIHVMESQHIDAIKAMVLKRTPNSPWSNALYEPEMRKKTCLRRHWKTEPWSVEIAQAIDHEEQVERGEQPKAYQWNELTDIFPDAVDGDFSPIPDTPNEIDNLFGKQQYTTDKKPTREPGED